MVTGLLLRFQNFGYETIIEDFELEEYTIYNLLKKIRDGRFKFILAAAAVPLVILELAFEQILDKFYF